MGANIKMKLLTSVHISIVLSMLVFKSEGSRFDSELSRENLLMLLCRCSVHRTIEQNREDDRCIFRSMYGASEIRHSEFPI